MPVIQAEPLRGWVGQVLAASGASEEQAEIISNHLVEANLMGQPFREGTDEVLTAGEPEQRRMAEHLANGIELDDEALRQMNEATGMVGVGALEL